MPGFGKLHIPVTEQINDTMTGRDVADTQNELYRLDQELYMLVKDLTVDERRAVNDRVRAYVLKKA